MNRIKQETGIDCRFQEEMFSLVMDTVAPWAFAEMTPVQADRERKNWQIRDISLKDDQARVCVMHVTSKNQYTALVCCLSEPEIVAVSFTDGRLGMLNPYLDCGYKLESDLDGPGCWNVLSITFQAEDGAEKIRFLRRGVVEEVEVNQFGAFSIIDWDSNYPVDEYLGVKVNGIWQASVVGAIPYTIDFMTSCWRKAVFRQDGMRNRWNRWITAAFVELCGSDRAILQREIMNALAREENQECYQAFKKERRRFLEREKQPLDDLQLSA